jgi:hypothetical protein
MVLAVIVNLFFLSGQSSDKQKESIIQGGRQQGVPTAPALPQQRPVALPKK